MTTIIKPGETCWRVERANRAAVIVDADAYYRAAKRAMLAAEKRIMLVGWDFDVRIELEPTGATIEGPNILGDFLEWLSDRRPALQVLMLKWDLGILYSIARGETPLYMLRWLLNGQVRLRLDHAHPFGSAHHQKLVVVDDAMAFCGGIDMTVQRWDRREHAPGDPARHSPRGVLLGPWHDATTAVDGPAAAALAELARQRWAAAGGRKLAPVSGGADPWPESLVPTMRDADVAIARTLPAMGEQPQVSEVEQLWLAAIAAAKRILYIESQYFASRRLAEAIAARLAEPDGPEIVVINPQTADGWLESKAMDSARARLLHLVRAADRHDRFRIYHPVNAAGEPIYVHAKVMVVDDRLLRVGSSNLNNRSQGFDTECDLAIEAAEGDDARRAEIAGVAAELLAEHLGVTADEVRAGLAESNGSMIAVIERLNQAGTWPALARGLVPIVALPLDPLQAALAETDLVDPERPSKPWRSRRRYRPRQWLVWTLRLLRGGR